jgi:hypothetical protein
MPVYTNSLLAILNTRKMIRGAGENIHNTSDNFSLSLRVFPKTGTVSSRVNDSSNYVGALDWHTPVPDKHFPKKQHQRVYNRPRPWSRFREGRIWSCESKIYLSDFFFHWWTCGCTDSLPGPQSILSIRKRMLVKELGFSLSSSRASPHGFSVCSAYS